MYVCCTKHTGGLRDISRTLWATGILGKVAPVPAIFMLYYANAISETKSHLKYYYNVLQWIHFEIQNIDNLLTK
jgi:hypothetical protein